MNTSNNSEITKRLSSRLKLLLAELDIELVHKPASENIEADYFISLNTISASHDRKYANSRRLSVNYEMMNNNKIVFSNSGEEEFLLLSHLFFIHPCIKNIMKQLQARFYRRAEK